MVFRLSLLLTHQLGNPLPLIGTKIAQLTICFKIMFALLFVVRKGNVPGLKLNIQARKTGAIAKINDDNLCMLRVVSHAILLAQKKDN